MEEVTGQLDRALTRDRQLPGYHPIHERYQQEVAKRNAKLLQARWVVVGGGGRLLDNV